MCWFNYSNYSHFSFGISYLFLSQKELQAPILGRILYLFWWEILQSFHCLSNFFSNSIFISKKRWFQLYTFFHSYYNYFYRTLAAIHSFSVSVSFSDVKICNYLLLPTHFFQSVSEYQSRWNKLLIEAIFSEQHHLNWNESSHFK